MPRVFWDFEFTALTYMAQPISLGCVTDFSAWTFYAEFSDYDEAQCSDFVVDHVLPKLHYRDAAAGAQPPSITGQTLFKGDTFTTALRLANWLHALHGRGHGEPIEMWGDVCAYDWMLFTRMFNGILPKFVYYIPFDIATVMKVKGVDPDINRIDFVGTAQGTEHDALQDAATIALCYAKLMEE